jgi:hypothetical protein
LCWPSDRKIHRKPSCTCANCADCRSCCFEDRGSETQSGSKFGSNKGFYQLLFA